MFFHVHQRTEPNDLLFKFSHYLIRRTVFLTFIIQQTYCKYKEEFVQNSVLHNFCLSNFSVHTFHLRIKISSKSTEKLNKHKSCKSKILKHCSNFEQTLVLFVDLKCCNGGKIQTAKLGRAVFLFIHLKI